MSKYLFIMNNRMLIRSSDYDVYCVQTILVPFTWILTVFGVGIGPVLGAMFSITLLSKKLQVDDSMLCLISITSKFVGAIWTAFVTTDLEMYLVPVVELLNATTFTSLRSIISKLVEKQEVAKMNSLFSLTETVANLMFHPFYAWMYMKTLQVMSGAVFLLSAALIIPAWVVLIVFYIQQRRELSKARKRALEAEDKKEAEIKKAEILNSLFVSGAKPTIDLADLNNILDVNEMIDRIDFNENKDSLVVADDISKNSIHKEDKEKVHNATEDQSTETNTQTKGDSNSPVPAAAENNNGIMKENEKNEY